MNRKNKIAAIFLTLCLALIPGCTQDNAEKPDTTPANTSAAENTNSENNTSSQGTESAPKDTSPADTEAAPAETTPAETSAEETESPSEDERLAYLDLLGEEYERYGRLYELEYGKPVCVNGKIIIPPYGDYSGVKLENMVVYDVKKREITLEKGDIRGSIAYDSKNGYIYIFELEKSLSKFDSSGSLICQAKLGGGYAVTPTVFPDGTFVIEKYSDHSYDLYSSDFKTVTTLPIPQVEVEHGIKKDIQKYKILAKYNNKIYAASLEVDTKGYYCLNTDTKTWEKVKSELNMNNNSIHYLYVTNIVGKYWFISGTTEGERKASTMVYDMETDTVIATLSTENYAYDGKGYGLGLQGGVLTKYQYPGDGSETVSEIVIDTGDKELNQLYGITDPFDEQYYVYRDDYGVFLREYGKGEDGEVTILLNEN